MASSFISPAWQRTSGQAPEEDMIFEDAPLQDAPGEGTEETKSDHQDDGVSNVSNEDPADPQFEEESVNPLLSPFKMALNLAEDNFPFLSCCTEESQRACDDTMNQGEQADEAEVTRKRKELHKPIDKPQKAQTNWDDLQLAVQQMRNPGSLLQQSASSNAPQGQKVNAPQGQNTSATNMPTTGNASQAGQTTVRTTNTSGSGGGEKPP